jgi:hypothetical protein
VLILQAFHYGHVSPADNEVLFKSVIKKMADVVEKRFAQVRPVHQMMTTAQCNAA